MLSLVIASCVLRHRQTPPHSRPSRQSETTQRPHAPRRHLIPDRLFPKHHYAIPGRVVTNQGGIESAALISISRCGMHTAFFSILLNPPDQNDSAEKQGEPFRHLFLLPKHLSAKRTIHWLRLPKSCAFRPVSV